eukprot:Skav235776  [mRNA]  locus=scaffold1891:6089:6277:- [translate_table: standard]
MNKAKILLLLVSWSKWLEVASVQTVHQPTSSNIFLKSPTANSAHRTNSAQKHSDRNKKHTKP